MEEYWKKWNLLSSRCSHNGISGRLRPRLLLTQGVLGASQRRGNHATPAVINEHVSDYALAMSLPTAYLTSFKNTADILQAIVAAQAPERFTIKFLEGLGYPSSNDRAMINVLKALGFLDDSGVPKKRYHQFLDQTQSGVVLSQSIREAYADLFRVNKNANTLAAPEVKNKMKTLSEGAYTDRVLSQMSGTFTTLVKVADFSAEPTKTPDPEVQDDTADEEEIVVEEEKKSPRRNTSRSRIGDFVYTINIVLPESTNPAVYDALFKALREHLGE